MNFNCVLLVALLLTTISCVSKLKESPFDTALRYTWEANHITREFGENFWDKAKNKHSLGVPVEDFVVQVKEIFGHVKLTKNPLVYEFDLNKNGYIDREESGLAFRNTFISIARDVAFNGLKYKAPKGKYQRAIDSHIFNISKKYDHVKELVDHLFDKADQNKNKLLSTKKFLETFSFKKTANLDNIINTVNPSGEEKIDKDQAFYLFCLLVLDSEVKEEGKDVQVLGAEDKNDRKDFLQKIIYWVACLS